MVWGFGCNHGGECIFGETLVSTKDSRSDWLWLYTASLAHIEASATASFKLLIPVGTAIIAMIWLDEQLTSRSLLGMLCIIGGILLVIKQRTTTNYVSPPN